MRHRLPVCGECSCVRGRARGLCQGCCVAATLLPPPAPTPTTPCNDVVIGPPVYARVLIQQSRRHAHQHAPTDCGRRCSHVFAPPSVQAKPPPLRRVAALTIHLHPQPTHQTPPHVGVALGVAGRGATTVVAARRREPAPPERTSVCPPPSLTHTRGAGESAVPHHPPPTASRASEPPP